MCCDVVLVNAGIGFVEVRNGFVEVAISGQSTAEMAASVTTIAAVEATTTARWRRDHLIA